MPEPPDPKVRAHPAKAPPHAVAPIRAGASIPYAELAVTTNFTFLTGASHPEEFVEQSAALGHTAAAIADHNTLAGIVRAHVAAKQANIPLAVGCRLVLTDPPGAEMLLFVSSRASYARLCSLLTTGRRRAPKGECRLTLHDLLEHQEGLLCVSLPPQDIDQGALELIEGLAATFDDDRFSIAASPLYTGEDDIRFAQIDALCARLGVPMAAINDVRQHTTERKALQDVLTCIREGCTLETAGRRLAANRERHLKSPEQMARLFAGYPQALARSSAIARRAAQFSLDELKYEYPDEVCPEGRTPDEHLRHLTFAGAKQRYPQGVPAKVTKQLNHELALIAELDYAKYFLTVYEIVRFAREREIVCQGRGAAANSAVCYCLGVTSVDPDRIDVLFERFVSKERDEPPDIDIDFEHERREEVIQHIYERYGRDRAALTAEVISYRGRSAIREVGKALGLSLDCVDRLAKNLDKWGGGPIQAKRLREAGVNPDDPTILRLVELVNQIRGFPRHLGQHVGGFVITRGPLSQMVPVENAAMDGRTVIEWDKDDVDAMGMLKVDVLGLGMLTCVRKAFELLELHEGARLTLASTPPEDPEVYDMICEADTVGVFQIESRAQMQMLPRLRPRCFYDLVIEVAIVRPGPIHGDMVHPYLRRRRGEETVTHPSETAKRILGRTLGVPLFQEQAMALAIGCAGFTPGEADQLRRAMAAWKRKGDRILEFRDKLVSGMLAHGYERDFAERCFEQLKGFSEYGFPESHAASFALIVYVSCWLKKHRPAAFAAALINSQPMGFYAPAQIVRDAREHGVDVRPVDVNHSRWDCTLEDAGRAIRLGTRLVKSLKQEEADAIAHASLCAGGFATIEALWRASGVSVAALRALAHADAFNSMGLDRQQALWAIRPLRDERLPIFEGLARERATEIEPKVSLPAISAVDTVISDYESTGLSLKAHPVSFARERLRAMGAMEAIHLRDGARYPQDARVRVAGLVLVRQRPGTASGVVFITLEDETGIANLILHPSVYEKYRAAARHGLLLLVDGNVQREREVIHILARRLRDVGSALAGMTSRSRDFH